MDIVTLRGHHLRALHMYSCIGAYPISYAYGAAMQEHINKLFSRITSTPELPVELVTGPDALCASCPLRHEVCDYPGTDLLTIENFGLERQVYAAKHLLNRFRAFSYAPGTVRALRERAERKKKMLEKR